MRLPKVPPVETFVVRVWTPDVEEAQPGIRGVAVHVRSGRTLTYTASSQLVRFLVETAGDRTASDDRDGGDHLEADVEQPIELNHQQPDATTRSD